MKVVLYYFWIFVITSILGFVIETLWCFIKNKKFESRKGVIYEPMIPIYGISGTLIVLVCRLFKLGKEYEIFFIGFLISTFIEFLASLLQEKIFATKSWDYKNFPLNLNGRVNLIYSIMFGLVTLMAYKLVLLPISELFINLNINILFIIISIAMLLFMLYDLSVSAIAVYRMKERKQKVVRETKFWNYIDNKYSDEFLKKIYANMKDVSN